jgi:hypothetical protein
MLAWTLQLLHTRLHAMLAQAGGADLANRLDAELIDRVLVDVEACSLEARTGATRP